MIEDLTFLEEEAFTQIDETVKNLAEKIKLEYKERKSVPGKISMYLSRGLQHNYENRKHPERSRTASEIIQSGYEECCSDRAVVFAAIARSLGIPTAFVDTLSVAWLEGPEELPVDGHPFVNIFHNGKWQPYGPLRGITPDKEFSLDRKSQGFVKFVEIGKGLDFGAVYLLENGAYRPEPVNMQDIHGKALEIKRAFSS